MKKLLVLLSIIGLTFSAYADKKESEKEKENTTTEEPRGNDKVPNEPAPTERPPTEPNEPREEPTPEPPSKTIITEVENSTQPNELTELDEIKAERKLLKEQKQALIAQVSELESDKKELKEDLEIASKQLQSFASERTEFRKTIRELGDVLDRGPGSLFRGWVYSPELKWVYISPTIVPYSFSQNDGWMLYEYGTNPRRVYYYKTKEWRLLDNENKK